MYYWSGACKQRNSLLDYAEGRSVCLGGGNSLWPTHSVMGLGRCLRGAATWWRNTEGRRLMSRSERLQSQMTHENTVSLRPVCWATDDGQGRIIRGRLSGSFRSDDGWLSAVTLVTLFWSLPRCGELEHNHEELLRPIRALRAEWLSTNQPPIFHSAWGDVVSGTQYGSNENFFWGTENFHIIELNGVSPTE